MLEYICLKCGRLSYSAAPPQYLLNSDCTYNDCNGKVVLNEEELEKEYDKKE